MQCLSGTLLTLLQLFTIYYIVCVLLGAPLFSEVYSTSALSSWLAVITGVPLSIVYKGDNHIRAFILHSRCSTLLELSAHRVIIGAVVGAWFGAFVIALDWDRWWQRYPFPNFVGSCCGCALGFLAAQLQWFLRRHRRKKLP